MHNNHIDAILDCKNFKNQTNELKTLFPKWSDQSIIDKNQFFKVLHDMPDYDFFNLSPIDFEDLSRDLLQKFLGVYLESFAPGRDSGIDLRYSKDGRNSFIIQCKRYKDYSNLKLNLKNETDKVKRLNPYRYILTTSVGLTPANKDEIKKIFRPFIKNTSDIFGKNDVNNLLGKYPEIEKHHFKLWPERYKWPNGRRNN